MTKQLFPTAGAAQVARAACSVRVAAVTLFAALVAAMLARPGALAAEPTPPSAPQSASPAPSPDPVHLRVVGTTKQGWPSATALAEALASDLGQAVVLVAADGLCPVLCVEVAFDQAATEGPSVMVRIMGRRSELRERRMVLPADQAQWLEASTLLAGNLVRDEAAALIAALSPPTTATDAVPGSAPDALLEHAPVTQPDAVPVAAPVTVPVPASVTAPPPHSAVAFGLVPPVSSDGSQTGKRSHDFSLDLLVGVSGGSSGFSLSGLADIERGDARGVQIGGLVARARDVRGLQVGGLVSAATSLRGVQLAGVLNTSTMGADRGVQIAGVANHGIRPALQLAGGINVAPSKAGWQIAGGSNYAHRADVQIAGASNTLMGPDAVARFQLAGGLNGAERVTGVQIAAFNVADRVDGLQLGAVNVAVKSNNALQIGAINIAGKSDGVSIGAINIIPGGRTDLDVYADTDGTGTLLLRHGSRRWHNVYGIAGNRGSAATALDDQDRLWMYGLGMGSGGALWRGHLDLEAMYWQVHHGTQGFDDLQLLTQLRATYAHPITDKLAVIGGLVLNAYVTDDGDTNEISFGRGTYLSQGDGDQVRVRSWATGYLGVRF